MNRPHNVGVGLVVALHVLMHQASGLHADPASGQISKRINGDAWDPDKSVTAPFGLSPSDDAAQVETSLSQWSAYLRGQDQRKIESLETLTLQDLELPAPVPADGRVFDIWASTRIEGLSDGLDRRGVNSRIGADYTLSRAMLLGASFEFQDTEGGMHDSQFGSGDGKAYLAGPYLGLRLGESFSLDATAGWGRAQDAGDIGIATNNGVTERSVANATVKNTWRLHQWLLSPTATLSYAREAPAGSPEDGSVKRQLSIGPELRRKMRTDGGQTIEPFVTYRGTVEGRSNIEGLDLDATIGGGVSVAREDSYRIDATTEIDDLDGDPSVSGRLKVTVPLD